ADYYDAPPGEVLRTALPPGTSEAYARRLVLTERGRAVLDGDGGALPRSTRNLLASLAPGARGRSRIPAGGRAAVIPAGLAELEDQPRRPRARLRTLAV